MGVRRRARAAAALLAMLFAPGLSWAAAEPSVEARAVALLQPAAAASKRGAAAEAAAQFETAAAIAEIAAPARVLAARAWLDAQEPAAAEAAARSGLERDAGAPWDADLFEALASARLAQGDAVGARRAWRETLVRGVEPARAAEIRLALAASLDASEVDAIAGELRTAWIEGTPHAASDRAEEQLGLLEQRVGHALRTASDWSARADRLFAAQRTESAQRAYEAALAAGAEGDARRHAARRRAECLFRSRRYGDAAGAFAALGDDPDASVWHARSLARADRVEEAIAELEAIAKRPPRETGAWASYLAGLLYDGRGRSDQARANFERAAAGGDAKVAADALWRLGFAAYRANDHPAAERHLDALAAQPGDPIDRLMARYWAARARPAAAQRNAELAAVAHEFPFSYYGVRAAELAPSTRKPSTRRLDDDPMTLREPDLVAVRALSAATLAPSAFRLAAWLEGQAKSPRDRAELARLYAGMGAPDRAQALLVRRDAEQLARGPIAGLEELWRLAWPDAFSRERRAARPRGGAIDPWLVAALMREESGYRADAVSVTGALGLLQLMPSTAEGVARRAGIPGFARARLLEPAYNIQLATRHLEELAARFPGRPDAIAAAYNAGAGAVASWPRPASGDDVEWVESIPYDETRGYVKRVHRSLHVYRELYP